MNPKLMRARLKYEGMTFKTNNCGDCAVIEYNNAKDIVVRFLETHTTVTVNIGSLLSGRIKDYSKPSVFGVGILGEEFTSQDRGSKEHTLWRNMLKRCYCEKSIIASPNYYGCNVSDKFKHYTLFKEWCNKQIGFDQDGWQLDKDILVRGNRNYSENNCCFVPREINSLLLKSDKKRGETLIGVHFHKQHNKFQAQFSVKDTKQHLGWFTTEIEAFYAYKQAKEAYIKEVANKWKDQIDHRVYEALMNYQVEITD